MYNFFFQLNPVPCIVQDYLLKSLLFRGYRYNHKFLLLF